MTEREIGTARYGRLMGPDALDAELHHIAAQSLGAATLETVGVSRSGRPIQMLSIGNGERSALMVAGAHSNEPSGPVAACTLAARLVAAPALRDALGYRWHFVACIDPDGLAMNEGWLADRSPQAYFEHYFRPALHRQGEYSFPLTSGNYKFDQQPPENDAWCEALERTRPVLHIDTHNSDMAGVFYVASQSKGLGPKLATDTAAAGLLLNVVGEPFGEVFSSMQEFGPGYWGFMDIPKLAKAGHWSAGNNSALYAAERYGTFSLIAEAPLWDDHRLRDHSISPFNLGDAITRHCARLRSLIDTLPKMLSALPATAEGDMGELYAVLVEAAGTAPGAIAEMTAMAGARDWSAPISVSHFTLHDGFLSFMHARVPAMLARYAQCLADQDSRFVAIANAAKLERGAAVAAALAGTRLTPLPVETMVKIQMDSAISAAKALNA
jgi:hypothetical protein